MRPRIVPDAEIETTAPDGVAQLPPPALPPRIRTLVVSWDVAYRERAMTVLDEIGPVAFALGMLSDPDDALALLQAARADVVVLDATGCERSVSAVVARLAEVAPRAGVVVVCHHCTDAAQALNALPKWGWTQDLRAAVTLAAQDGNPLRPSLSLASRRRAPERPAGPLQRR